MYTCVNYVPTLCTVRSICGLIILYHRYVAATNNLEFGKLHVRQNGCENAASIVKYLSIAARWREGGDCVRRWITPGISLTVQGGEMLAWLCMKRGGGDGPGFSILEIDGVIGMGWDGMGWDAVLGWRWREEKLGIAVSCRETFGIWHVKPCYHDVIFVFTSAWT
jgi:hypothetical protein